ncbi:ABC-three component system middle component 7 [Ruminiclostridium cellobioparum]|uniref:ABC-three component system middle component 7 n=1 Tax=Ruminiclostridium cellobioparum TaxID=29355 RepID=UPI0028AFDA6D|nr:ABC-three component system middle component 7 [Ruminiclostridium cellobioparum]
MRMPSKVNSYSDSVISLFAPILEKLEERDMTPHELLEATRTKVLEISVFLDALDCLYKLGQIEIPEGMEVLRYVKTNNMR